MKDVIVLFEVRLEIEEDLDRDTVLEIAHREFQKGNYEAMTMKVSNWDFLKEEGQFLLSIETDEE
jgi:hypothetical protein